MADSRSSGPGVSFDATVPRHLHVIGQYLWNRTTDADGSLFAVGSSGLERHVFTTHWADTIVISGTHRAFGNPDLLYLVGGGILIRPDGATAGGGYRVI